jgi:hypothetical protein
MLSCASLKGIVALSHIPQLSVNCPCEAITRKAEQGTRGFTRGALLSIPSLQDQIALEGRRFGEVRERNQGKRRSDTEV